jgi:hypothetical protein
MLLGHIDLVDRDAVRGWAADTDRPYGTIEVAVFVNGKLAGLARADQARDDLKDSAALGSGLHGIAYKFAPPLSSVQDHEVVVRFAEGGKLLGQWRVGREAEAVAPPPEPIAETPDPEPKPEPEAEPRAPVVVSARRFGSGALPQDKLVGFVDQCTRQGLRGWAASRSDPDEIVDISIFVDQHKVAQLACNQPRDDLAKAGSYGDGARGFSYRFDVPLSVNRPTRVTVIHSRTGVPLSEGDVEIVNGKAEAVERIPALSEDEPRLLQLPVEPRGMFEWLGLHDGAGGLQQLLNRIEFTGQRPEQVYYSVFGTYPDSVEDVLRWGTYYPRDHLQELLLSDRFQTSLIQLFLRAFPEKRRLIFVHIPKCAGTDLTYHFRARYPSLDRTLTDPEWFTKADMLRRLARVAGHVRVSDSIFVHGHINLADYLGASLVRPTDHVFTILRDPLAVAISQINYILTRFDEDIAAGQLRPDTSGWAAMMDLGEMPGSMSDDFVRRVARSALRNEDLTVPNSLCLWLGGGGAQRVADRLATYDVEVTDIARYNEWLRREWGIDAQTRWNESKKFISVQTMSADDITYLNGITRDDQKLFQAVDKVLSATGKLSLGAEELRGIIAA